MLYRGNWKNTKHLRPAGSKCHCDGLPDCATSSGLVDLGRLPNPAPHPSHYEFSHFLWGLCSRGTKIQVVVFHVVAQSRQYGPPLVLFPAQFVRTDVYPSGPKWAN